MAIRLFKIFFGILLISLLQSCPGGVGEEVCNDMEASAYIDDLITITPLKQVYSQGEEITYRLVIPSENNYFGSSVNLYQKTGVKDAWYIASSTFLFDGNPFSYAKGSARQGSANWHNATYNPANGNYELEIKVKLNKVGNYSLYCRDFIDFLGTPKCNRNTITTTIQGKNTDNFIEFKVQ